MKATKAVMINENMVGVEVLNIQDVGEGTGSRT